MPTSTPLWISRHAVVRYRQRVASVSATAALHQLADLAASATRRPTPRWWTPVDPAPGVLFLYPHANSQICLVVKHDTVVTVFARVVCLEWRRPEGRTARHRPRKQPYRRPAPGALPLEAA